MHKLNNPDLTTDICSICNGPLTPETAHTDQFGGTWAVHKGMCAYLAGDVGALHNEPKMRWWRFLFGRSGK